MLSKWKRNEQVFVRDVRERFLQSLRMYGRYKKGEEKPAYLQ